MLPTIRVTVIDLTENGQAFNDGRHSIIEGNDFLSCVGIPGPTAGDPVGYSTQILSRGEMENLSILVIDLLSYLETCAPGFMKLVTEQAKEFASDWANENSIKA